jgi:small-conductance mechanosensitive channel
MLRMGIGGVMVRMIRFTMFMAMNMAVFMAVSLKRNTIRLADSRAFPFAECAAFSESLHVMVVALLGSSNILFKAQNLGSVLAERAIHCRVSSEHFVHPLSECVHHHRVLT